MNTISYTSLIYRVYIKWQLLTVLFLFIIAISGSICLAESALPRINFVPDVTDQFKKLSLRPEGLAFGIGSSPNPELCKHYQGIARSNGGGAPFLFVSRSGNEPSGPASFGCSDSDDPGNLLIVKLASRNIDGERLRSNRLERDSDINSTPPDSRDTTVKFISFDGENGWPNYGHPGGLQTIDDVLVLALETPYDKDLDENIILFMDISNPEQPVITSQFNPGTSENFKAGLVGIAPVQAQNGECCRYLMIVTGGENLEIRLYRSSPNGSGLTTDIKATDLDWDFLESWNKTKIESCLDGSDWYTGAGKAHQMLNFVRQQNIDGPLFLIGGRNTTLLPSGNDYLDLYRVHIDSQGNPKECLLTLESSKHVKSKPIMGGGDSANFAAAGGVYVSPSGELIIYSTEYKNDGPDGTVRFAEWRHRNIVRSGSPTLRPTVDHSGPYTVEEGSSVMLSSHGKGPITRAWLQLFEDDGLGLSLSLKDDWLVVDYNDWYKDNFNDFRKLNYSDDAGSWRWFAPEGCTIRVNDDDFESDNFPGKFTRTLFGTGLVEEESDLDSVTNNNGDKSMDDEITSMEFFPNCDDYYNAAISVRWDLDGNGEFETDGEEPVYNAVDLDGPDEISVLVRGEHPTDSTSLGLGLPVPVKIMVNNAPPVIESFHIYDALGLEVGVDIPFAFVNLELSAEGTFTDVGKPDTQTATIDWNDSAVDPSTEFDVFSDAWGGVTGKFEQQHIYTQVGDYSIHLNLVDDDGGSSDITLGINIASPIDALGSIVEELDVILAVTTSPSEYIAAILDARNNLAGNDLGEADNGALDKLTSEEPRAALTMIEATLEALQLAEIKGLVDLSYMMNIMGLTAEALSHAVYLDAVAAVGIPSRGEEKQLQRIQKSIADGHALLLSGDYLAAVANYQNAVGRANMLLL